MRTISILCLALIALLASCKKDDDAKFSSAEGNWTYTTPDGKISVDFTLVKSGTSWSVTNPATMRVEGVSGAAAAVADGINPPAISSLRINANDVNLTYNYSIEFTNGTVNSDFTKIEVPGAVYTWPIDKTNSLTSITITRK